MKNRSVVISLCASIVGVMVGTIAIGLTENLSITSNAVMFRDPAIKPGMESRMRHVTVTPLKAAAHSSEAPVIVTESAACTAVRSALERMAVVEDQVIPFDLDMDTIQAIERSRAAIIAENCAVEAAVSTSSAASLAPATRAPRINTCNRFARTSSRFMQCMIDHNWKLND